jgi:hypothetical protein
MVMYLNVPYAEKEHAKQRGARWDGKKRQWYVPDGGNVMACQRWWSCSPKPTRPLPKLVPKRRG